MNWSLTRRNIYKFAGVEYLKSTTKFCSRVRLVAISSPLCSFEFLNIAEKSKKLQAETSPKRTKADNHLLQNKQKSSVATPPIEVYDMYHVTMPLLVYQRHMLAVVYYMKDKSVIPHRRMGSSCRHGNAQLGDKLLLKTPDRHVQLVLPTLVNSC